jgi:dimeric dUTPase (all-alpha-NTP-PPase superfamily)
MDMEQVRMELVDIFHFAMSDLLIKNGVNLEAAARHIDAEMARGNVDVSVSITSGEVVHNHKMGNEDIRDRMEAMVGLAACGYFSFSLFAALLKDVGMTMDDLFKQYVAKNVLNFFRQDNGYKEGTYRKVWSGREDNEHLVELMAEVDFSKSSARDALYGLLSQRYAATA